MAENTLLRQDAQCEINIDFFQGPILVNSHSSVAAGKELGLKLAKTGNAVAATMVTVSRKPLAWHSVWLSGHAGDRRRRQQEQ